MTAAAEETVAGTGGTTRGGGSGSATATGKTATKGPGRKSGAKKRPPAKRRARGGAAPAPRPGHRVAILGGIAVALAAAFHVWTGLQVSELGYERSQWIKINRALETQRQEAVDELASLLRTDYLEDEAERRLGLLPPAAGQVVDLRAKQLAEATRRTAR